MNFNFEGNYKAKRNINLGGVRAQEDKKRLLEKAQRERKAREAERLRNKTATKIQAFYRGRQEASRNRTALRQDFEGSFSKLQQLLQEQCTPDDIAQSEVQTLRLLLGLMKEDGPNTRHVVTQFLEWLLIPHNNAIVLPWLSDDEELGDIWEWQIRLLLSRMTLTFDKSAPVDNLTRLHFMQLLLSKETYSTKGISTEVADSIRQSVAKHLLIRKNIYNTIHTYFSEHDQDEMEQIEALVGLLINILKIEYQTPGFSTGGEDMTRTFVMQILTIRSLAQRISPHHYASVLQVIGIERVLRAILEVGQEQSLEPTKLIGLLENMISMKSSAKLTLSSKDMICFAQVLVLILQQSSPHFFVESEETNETQMIENESDESDEEDRDIDMDAQDNKGDEFKWKDLDTNEQKCLSELHDEAFLTDIVNSLFSHDQPNGIDRHTAITLLSEIFNLLIIRWPMYKIKIFGLLLYNLTIPDSTTGTHNFVQELWSVWKSGTVSQEIGKLPLASSSSRIVSYILNPVYRGEWNILMMLCELYHRSLVTIGDDEFFNSQEGKNPLDTQEILDLSLDLKSITFALFWNASLLDVDTSNTGTVDLNALRSSVTRLIQHLHARDSRRPFCPPDFWFIVGLDIATFRETAIADEFSMGTEVQDNRTPRKAPSKLRMARISPHLGILNNIPFVLPFEDRVEVFRMFIRNDRRSLYGGMMQVPDDADIDFSFLPPVARVTIRRDHVFEDGFTHLYGLGADLRRKIAISFVDEFGLLEAGVDGGGVFKEFLTTLARQAFDVNYGLFMVTEDQLLYPNSSKYARETAQLAYFEFLGLIIGKALYEGILVEVAFAGFFLSKCLGKMNYLDDLPSLDYELYKGLINLKNYDGNVEDLCLDFSITDNNVESSEIIDLIPNGRNVPVTNENRIRYIYLVANYRLNIQIGRQCKAFFRGLSTIIDPKWIRMFNQKELQVLLGGASIPIDIEDLRANTVYSGYTEDEDIIENFWTVLREIDNEQRSKFVKFVTSCSRPPLLGFKGLNPQFCIRNAGGFDSRLPTSSTCVNLLKLPRYSNLDILKQKLLYAINAEAGFDLS
ncbi:hypothetical protein K450DRAFT_223827 [Umbelopsis ramanniana AG]|uniref:HECT-type E3 ubiquitin transferase n=1 Tax=Umbelopsis ramanniana AG TaxID=1314678 RepID=A0AAD5EH91_UMBRA|nr:uncharacterized protein K450DRAFT_223827 [Umbelopsis ramanniana AG]KAI8583464.1 hypothetical protein K450DRAFT_223827 [Umbelopsis ramanniana AG]